MYNIVPSETFSTKWRTKITSIQIKTIEQRICIVQYRNLRIMLGLCTVSARFMLDLFIKPIYDRFKTRICRILVTSEGFFHGGSSANINSPNPLRCNSSSSCCPSSTARYNTAYYVQYDNTMLVQNPSQIQPRTVRWIFSCPYSYIFLTAAGNNFRDSKVPARVCVA